MTLVFLVLLVADWWLLAHYHCDELLLVLLDALILVPKLDVLLVG